MLGSEPQERQIPEAVAGVALVGVAMAATAAAE